MFDTNIFNKIFDENIDITNFPKTNNYYITHIQKDEIEKIKDPTRKNKIKQLFILINEEIATDSFVLGYSTFGKAKLSSIKIKQIPTESMVWDKSKWGSAKWSSENNTLLDYIRQGNLKHTEDALIGETAIKNKIILVTEDKKFRKKICALNGKAITFKDFIDCNF